MRTLKGIFVSLPGADTPGHDDGDDDDDTAQVEASAILA